MKDSRYLLMQEIDEEIAKFKNMTGPTFNMLEAMKDIDEEITPPVVEELKTEKPLKLHTNAIQESLFTKITLPGVSAKEEKVTATKEILHATDKTLEERARRFKKDRREFAVSMALMAREQRPATFTALHETILDKWGEMLTDKPSYDVGRNFALAILSRMLPGETDFDITSGTAPKDILWL